jgi:hypothetical protein
VRRDSLRLQSSCCKLVIIITWINLFNWIAVKEKGQKEKVSPAYSSLLSPFMFINRGPELLTVTGSLKLDQNMNTSASIYQHENIQRFQIPDFFFPLNIPISLVFFRHYPHFFSAFELCDSWGGGQIFWVFIKKVPLHDAIYKKIL